MHTAHPFPIPDTVLFDQNRRLFPVEQLARYSGKHVAWAMDGRSILAAADSPEDVDRRLTAMGIPTGQVVHDYIDSF